jgi:hypothetical protein
MLEAGLKQREVDERRDLDDAAVVQVLTAYARKVKDQLRSCTDAGRQDLAAKSETELAIVQEFLPAELTDAEVERIAREVIAATGAASPADLGRVMKSILPQVAGRADGKRVSSVVKRLLQG